VQNKDLTLFLGSWDYGVCQKLEKINLDRNSKNSEMD